MGPMGMSAGRLNVLAVTGLSGVLTLLGQGYGSAELPHTAACVTVIVPLAGLGWLLRSVLPPLAALALVLFIQVSA